MDPDMQQSKFYNNRSSQMHQHINHTCFFFFGLLFRRGLRASEFELRLLLGSPCAFTGLQFLEEGPLLLFEVLLDVDRSAFATEWLLLGGKERGGGMRTRADICLCMEVSAKCMPSKTVIIRQRWTKVKRKLKRIWHSWENLIFFITGHARCCFARST